MKKVRHHVSLSNTHSDVCAIQSGWQSPWLKQGVVRIEVIDVGGGDDLVLDELGWWSRPLGKDLEREINQFLPVFLRKVRDRPDKRRVVRAQLGAGVRFGVLPDDGAMRGRGQLPETPAPRQGRWNR